MAVTNRRVKSVSSFQKSSWDDRTEDGENNGTVDEGEEQNKPETSSANPLFTLPNGISVRRFRREDAKALQALVDNSDISFFFVDTYLRQPFSLWQAHKFLDEIFDQHKSWRPQRLSNADDPKEKQDIAYNQAVRALAETNLDDRLQKQAILGNSVGSNVPSQSTEVALSTATTKSTLKLPIAYAIADAADSLIGLIDLGFEDSVPQDAESRDNGNNNDDPVEPAFLHQAELCYFLSTSHRNEGIMTEVVSRFVDWTWHSFAQLERLEASVFATWNAPSRAVLRKNGFSLEGTSIGAVRKMGLWGDSELYVLFRPGGQLEARRDNAK